MIKTKSNTAASSATRTLGYCSILAVIYVLLELLLPVSQASVQAYKLSTLDYRLSIILSNLPVILVWFVAFWGYSKLNQYVLALRNAPESSGFKRLATGITWLAWSLPITLIISRILSGISNHNQKLHPATVVITNYLDLVFPFIAFLIIGSAARAVLVSQKWNIKLPSFYIMAFFLLGGALYCYLTLKTFASYSGTHNVYSMPAWLTIISLIIPYLYASFIGLLAAYELSLFSIKIPGILYKRALITLVFGLVAIIVSFTLSQYLNAVWPTKAHLVFDYKLVVITLVRVIGGVGFVLLAYGANKLRSIEEV